MSVLQMTAWVHIRCSMGNELCVCVFWHLTSVQLQDSIPKMYATLKLGPAAQALFISPHTHKDSKYLVCCPLIFIVLFYCQLICPWMNVDAADFFEKFITTYIVYTIYLSYVVYAAYITYRLHSLLHNLHSVHSLNNLHNLRSLHNLQSTQST